MTISVVFDPPLPSDNPADFNTKAFALLGDLNTWSTQANALPGEVATNLSALLAAPPAIGSTTPAAGSFTTLSASGANGAISTLFPIYGTAGVAGGTTPSNLSTDGNFGVGRIDLTGASTFGVSIQTSPQTTTGAARTWTERLGISNSGAVTIPGSLTSESVTITGGAYAVGKIYYEAAGGIVVVGKAGSASDLVLCNGTGRNAVEILAGTTPTVKIPGSLSLAGGTFGYGTGAGGTVTQTANKSTAVTLNKACGQITMNNAALAAGATVLFQVTNSLALSSSIVVVNANANPAGEFYSVWCSHSFAGGFFVGIRNITAVPLSDALVLNFALLTGATS
jgi:hypothetical protein